MFFKKGDKILIVGSMIYNRRFDNFDEDMFRDPPSIYRGAPFWAWNCELNEAELCEQINILAKMGFGGVHIHSRCGLATEYLGENFMSIVRACIDKAKLNNMHVWLYDEDRWPSGFGGGNVTKIPEYRCRSLLFTKNKLTDMQTKESALHSGGTYFIGKYSIELNSDGTLKSYSELNEDENGEGIIRYAYCVADEPSGRMNGQTYVDVMNKNAIRKFISVTHERYKNAIGEEFGKTIPAIFTDEPQFAKKETLTFAFSESDIRLPWTADFPESFYKIYSTDIIRHLPEIIWDLPDGQVSYIRYCYHNHICDRFVESYCDTYADWCEKNNIYFTGHAMDEGTLSSQTATSGEVMRFYRRLGIPGVDMLMDRREYTTVKQAASIAHQYGREGVLSELYGVTNWDFDFRGHKFQGDWQAALGVTVRVPHLSWVSMKGSAKRDYPATINYQSPWYSKYSYIEDHFARLNTVLTRGTPRVKVGIIHPIESLWLHYGPNENTYDIRTELDKKLSDLTQWMIFGLIDFDFISESCFEELYEQSNEGIKVGEMQYAAIVVPGCETLRKSTVNILYDIYNNGRPVIFMGECPLYVNAKRSDEVKYLYSNAKCITYDRLSLLRSLDFARDIKITDDKAIPCDKFIYQMRQDGEGFWLFIVNADKNEVKQNCDDIQPISASITVKGEFSPMVYDTLNGRKYMPEFKVSCKNTVIRYDFYKNSSLLIRLSPAQMREYSYTKKQSLLLDIIDCKAPVDYKLEEENVCLLDMAEYAVDGGRYNSIEEVLRIDNKIRSQYKLPLANGRGTQPWLTGKRQPTHYVSLKYTFDCQCDISNTSFCAEELISLELNGKNVALHKNGYFVDRSIIKYSLPILKKGKNTIIAVVPLGEQISIEPCYITGHFSCRLSGCGKTLGSPPDKIPYGSITEHGMPFYGGNIIYKQEVSIKEVCDVEVNVSWYNGAMTELFLDGNSVGNIVFEPYRLKIENVSAGTHVFEFKLYGNRYNTFGALHNCSSSIEYNPEYWYSGGDSWCYEYNLKKTGIMKSPVMRILKPIT